MIISCWLITKHISGRMMILTKLDWHCWLLFILILLLTKLGKCWCSMNEFKLIRLLLKLVWLDRRGIGGLILAKLDWLKLRNIIIIVIIWLLELVCWGWLNIIVIILGWELLLLLCLVIVHIVGLLKVELLLLAIIVW